MKRWPYVFAAAAFIAVIGSVSSASEAGAGGATSRDFTAKERKLLAAGKLIERPVIKRKGSLNLMGGTSWQVINAPPKTVWRALLDTPHYHRMMPQVLEARLVSKERDSRTVYMKQGQSLFHTSYYLKVKIHRDRRDITFQIDESRPHSLKAAWGFYSVRPYDKQRTLLAYGVMADIGHGLVSAIMRTTVHEWMLKVPWMVKRFVEGSGRWIYK